MYILLDFPEPLPSPQQVFIVVVVVNQNLNSEASYGVVYPENKRAGHVTNVELPKYLLYLILPTVPTYLPTYPSIVGYCTVYGDLTNPRPRPRGGGGQIFSWAM